MKDKEITNKKEIKYWEDIASKIERTKRAIAEFNKVAFENKHQDVVTQFKPTVEVSGGTNYYQLKCEFYVKHGEIFITMHKQGSTIRGLMDACATSMSFNLQYGAKVNDLFGKFRYQKFDKRSSKDSPS